MKNVFLLILVVVGICFTWSLTRYSIAAIYTPENIKHLSNKVNEHYYLQDIKFGCGLQKCRRVLYCNYENCNWRERAVILTAKGIDDIELLESGKLVIITKDIQIFLRPELDYIDYGIIEK